MGRGTYCVVCRNNKENLHFQAHLTSLFKFPINVELREKWIWSLQLDNKSIKTGSRVCELHFSKDQFVNSRLKPEVIPSLNLSSSNKKLEVTKSSILVPAIQNIQQVEVPKETMIDLHSSRSSIQHMTNAKSKQTLLKEKLHKIRCQRLRKEKREDRRRISRLKLKVKKLKERLSHSIDIKEVFRKNPTFSEIIESQAKRYQGKGRFYSDFEKTVALSLYYSCGKSGYKTLNKMGFDLPSQSTLCRWTQELETFTGINNQLLACIKNLTSNFITPDRDCIISWDEMSIKELLEYNKHLDMFEGIEDFGSHGRSLDLANEVLVFMIRGVNATWRYPVSYYFSRNSTTTEVLELLVEENICEVQKIGLNVRLGVCDMAFTNQALYKSWGITVETPFKVINNSKVVFIHDSPHLIKLVRNNLMKHSFEIEETINETTVIHRVKWTHITQFYSKDKRILSRTAPRITTAHVYVKDYSKMKVKYATQLLSHSVYAGMMSMIRLRILKDEFRHTAGFVKKMDELFDMLNMSSMYDDKWGRCAAYFYKNISKLDDFLNYLNSISVPTYHREEPEFLHGLKLTVSGISILAKDLNVEGYTHLLTRNLQQDFLENFFSLIRSKGGFCRNPTARAFRTSFRFLFFATMIHTPSTGNTEEKNRKFENYMKNMYQCLPQINIRKKKQVVLNPQPDLITSQEAARFYSVKLARQLKLGKEQESAVGSYVGAACIQASTKLTNCSNCKEMLVPKCVLSSSDIKNYVMIDFKQFDNMCSHLKYMRLEECSFFQYLSLRFLKIACEVVSSEGTNVSLNILEKLKGDKKVCNWLNTTCTVHRESILKYFIRAKLFRLIKDKNESTVKQIKSWGQSRRELRNQ